MPTKYQKQYILIDYLITQLYKDMEQTVNCGALKLIYISSTHFIKKDSNNIVYWNDCKQIETI